MSDFDSIDIIEEKLNLNKTNVLCQKIDQYYQHIWCISLRKCEINDENFEKLLRATKRCKNVSYLNLNVNIISSLNRAKILASCLVNLNNLNTLCLYSSNLGDAGLKILYNSIYSNRSLLSLDLGDSKLSDKSIDCINSLIYIDDEHNWPGLQEFGLSANELITSTGWYQILLAVAASSRLKHFRIDYNNIDDVCGYLLVAIVAATDTLETLDLEHTLLTDASAKLFCYLIENYPVKVKYLNLIHNKIKPTIIKRIENILNMTSDGPYSSDGLDDKLNNKEAAKLDNYIKNAKNFTKNINVHDLGRDNSDINNHNSKNNNNKFLKSTLKNSNKKIQENILMKEFPKKTPLSKNDEKIEHDNGDDLLEPVDDLRFKTHHVLPFNLLN